MSLVVAQVKGPAVLTVRPDSKAGDESRTHDSHVGNVMVSSISLYIAKSCGKCISKVTNLVLQGSKSGRSQSQDVIHWQNYSWASSHNSDIFRPCQFVKYQQLAFNFGDFVFSVIMALKYKPGRGF